LLGASVSIGTEANTRKSDKYLYILDFYATYRMLCSFRLRPLYPRGKYLLDVEPLRHSGLRKESLFSTGNTPRFCSRRKFLF
jgi:hypothetical protein